MVERWQQNQQAERLQKIYSEWAADRRFDSFKQLGFNFVPGEGPLCPQFMFIGEAPGAVEDELKRPFVGSSGRFLEEALKAAGLSRKGVFLTNAFKFRPSDDNRKPRMSELVAGLDYLRWEILIVWPRVLVTLGATALSAVNPDLQLSLCRGRVFKTSIGIPLVPLYHPSYGLRPGNQESFIRSFVELPRLFKKEPSGA